MATDSDYRSPLTSQRCLQWVVPLVAEFFGMVFFVFIHCLGTHSLPASVSALNDGFIVTIIIIIIGPISGALINPAVTIAVALSGNMKWTMAPLCIVVQLLGSLCGATLAKVACGSASGYFSLGTGINVVQGVLAEFMFTVLLVFTALQTAVDVGPPMAAFAVGFVVICDIMAGANISGASMNPALSFGPAAVAGVWENHWIYWLGPLGGACIAVAFHKLAMASRRSKISDCGRSSISKDHSIKRRNDDEANLVSAV